MSVDEARKKWVAGRPKRKPLKHGSFQDKDTSADHVTIKFDTKEAIATLLRDKMWAIKILEELYKKQTPYEQSLGTTKMVNQMGFNKNDADILSSIAKWYAERGWISPKQHNVISNRLIKYHKQITKLIGEGRVLI